MNQQTELAKLEELREVMEAYIPKFAKVPGISVRGFVENTVILQRAVR